MKIRFLSVLLKTSLLAAVLVFIYLKIRNRNEIATTLITLIKDSIVEYYYFYIFVIILMPLNWMLEAIKWQVLVKKVKVLSLKSAFVGVLTGLSIGFISPHGIGDYIGRIGQVNDKERTRLVGSLLLGRMTQLLSTLLFGAIGVGYLFGFVNLTIFLVGITFVLVALILSFDRLNGFLPKKWLEVSNHYLGLIRSYSKRDLLMVLGLSVFRYVTFSLQFFIVVTLFLPNIDWLKRMAGITWIFLAKSVIPTFNFLSDLGIREFSAVYFYERFDVNVEPIIAASLMIWIINILIPTICGVPFIMKLKVSTS